VEFTKPQIREMIEPQQTNYGWHFTFLNVAGGRQVSDMRGGEEAKTRGRGLSIRTECRNECVLFQSNSHGFLGYLKIQCQLLNQTLTLWVFE